MQSVSKRNIDVATARQMITAAFGAHAAIGRYAELRDGYFNAAYQIDLADGHRVVLKVAPSPGVRVMRYEHGILGSEVQMLRLVREHTQCARARGLLSRRLAHHHRQPLLPDVVCGRPGLPPGARAAIRRSGVPSSNRRSARYLRQINAISGPFFGYPARPAAATGAGGRPFLPCLKTCSRTDWRSTWCCR